MKVTKSQQFQPITITIETEEELHKLKQILEFTNSHTLMAYTAHAARVMLNMIYVATREDKQ